jgi:hypothetical protein
MVVIYCSWGVWAVELRGFCSYSSIEIAADNGSKLGLGVVYDVFNERGGLVFVNLSSLQG